MNAEIDRDDLAGLISEARRDGEWCCEAGCGSGACETCPCCSAGWCVSGIDGIPDGPEDRERWLETAAEHNPVAAALRAAAVVAGEPEWEYGWHTGSTVSLIGRRDQVGEWLAVRGWKLGEGDWGSRVMQRRVAGPWVPVMQES